MPKQTQPAKSGRFSPAARVILIFGLISMLGDMVYETARSANSQYLNLLDISAAQVGLVFGIGEFLGYCLRLLSGVLSDRSGKHWTFMFIGYGMLFAVPLMGFTHNWSLLVILILMERIGKAIRNPAKDTILSSVANDQLGIGMAFGIQEALDQVGAFAGPLIFTAVFALSGKQGVGEYQLGYRLLIIPFVLLMLFLVFAERRIERDNLIPEMKVKDYHQEKLPKIFWLYTLFTFFCTLGFTNFSTLGYHLKAQELLSDSQITLLYSIAMAIDAVAALAVGKGYDALKKKTGQKTGGILVLALIPFLTLALPILGLTQSIPLIVLGMLLFGVIMGTHETIMRSAIADITPYYKRGTGYGVFNTTYGLALFCGAALMGWLYNAERIDLIIYLSLAAEIIAVAFFIAIRKHIRSEA